MLETPALLAHSADLELVIRHVLAGLGHGIHAGRERGAGVEFSEYRAYAPGDEWRRVDWKLLARADRYYVREAERDSHVASWLVLDATASMAEPSRRVQGLSKHWFARTALACVAAIAQRQGDAFGLLVLSGGRIEFTPASRGPRQLQRVLAALQRATPSGELPDAETLRASLHFARSQSMVFAATDALDWPSPLGEALVRLRHMRHDVRMLALRTEAEAEGNIAPGHAYRDPEEGAGLHSFSRADRDAYRAALEAHFEAVRTACRRHDVPLCEARIEQPLVEVLRAWLRNPEARRP
ncbi:DUF58 domain-containing protein [Pseudoduganella sp. DS3]|uniref:DUF58 domain-containing protein n=1 Tax=Pseudoduganella guangdongensis TaxID=2692179 RepID=A0A6N9HM76_9BURK|nr:DUF58 domain-containing protein [Pseudoduganella guangdongensis]MYN04758.1 DUF58 domain-containing protein [Pseudoduganella guangdongensis]